MQYPMNDQGCPDGNLALLVEHLPALEAAHPALLGDLRALRQAVLKGSRLSPRDSESLATHLRATQALLTAATQAYEEMISSLRTPTSIPKGAESHDVVERRRAPRRPFGGVAEISTGFSDDHIVGLATELGRFGCFVRTQKSVPAGTKVSLKITHHGDEYVTPGEVVHVLAQKGIGIKFEPATPRDETMLEDWLSRP
jgi:hypothetical protein